MYTFEQITEAVLKGQCCFATLMYNVILAGKTGNDCKTSLELQAKMLESYIKALREYRPIDYEYLVNDEVFDTQLEEDLCLTDSEVQYLVEGINSLCQCSECLDLEEFLKDSI